MHSGIPLRKFAKDEETKLYVSNQSAGNFPAVLSEPEISDINIEIEDEHFMMIILDDGGTIGLFGRVTNLCADDFQSVVDQGEGCSRMFGCWLQRPEEWEWTSPNAIFTPTNVQVLVLEN